MRNISYFTIVTRTFK